MTSATVSGQLTVRDADGNVFTNVSSIAPDAMCYTNAGNSQCFDSSNLYLNNIGFIEFWNTGLIQGDANSPRLTIGASGPGTARFDSGSMSVPAGIDLYDKTHSNYIRLRSSNTVTSSTYTLPSALPASTLPMVSDSSGNLALVSTLTLTSLAFSGSGNATITEPNGLSGQIVISTKPADITATHLAIWSSSMTLIDGGVPGTGGGGGSSSGTVSVAAQYQIPFYAVAGSSNVLNSSANFTNNGTTITISGVYTVVETNVSTDTVTGVFFNYQGSSVTASSMSATYVNGVIPALVPGTNITSITGTWPNQTINAATQGGGGASALETMVNSVRITSPTATQNFIAGSNITLTGSVPAASTAAITIAATGLVQLSSFSATQPILYNSVTGAFNSTLISATTGFMGTLQAAQFPALTGSISNTAGSLVTTLGLVSLSTGVIGTLPAANLVSTVAYTSVNNVWTGNNDFGGGTGLEIPNAANPTVDATGEIAFDTTDGTLVAYDGSVANVVGFSTHSVTVSISSGTGWNSLAIPVWRAPTDMAITITKVMAASLPEGTTVLYQLNERGANPNVAGTDVFNMAYSSAEAKGITETDISNRGIAAESTLVLTTPANASSGTPSFMTFTIYYKRDLE